MSKVIFSDNVRYCLFLLYPATQSNVIIIKVCPKYRIVIKEHRIQIPPCISYQPCSFTMDNFKALVLFSSGSTVLFVNIWQKYSEHPLMFKSVSTISLHQVGKTSVRTYCGRQLVGFLTSPTYDCRPSPNSVQRSINRRVCYTLTAIRYYNLNQKVH